MLKKMTGKEMKKYASQMGLKLKDGKVVALLAAREKRVSVPIKTISGIPDNAKGWFDPDTKRFDASTPKTTLVAHFVGGSKPEKAKHDSYSGDFGCGSSKSYYSGCDSSSYSGCGSGFSSC